MCLLKRVSMKNSVLLNVALLHSKLPLMFSNEALSIFTFFRVITSHNMTDIQTQSS